MNELTYRPVTRTSDGSLLPAGRGEVKGILLKSGPDAATVDLYDGVSTGGVWLGALTTVGANEVVGLEFPGRGLRFEVGLYVDLSGTTPRVVAWIV